MNLSVSFFLTAIFLGIGLAMDAFSVSLVAGMGEPCMKKGKICAVAGTFSLFQALMPILGWFLVTTVMELFSAVKPFIPFLALIILSYIGVKMIIEGVKSRHECPVCPKISFSSLIVQGIATSLDALSVGLEIPSYSLAEALVTALVIAVVTFVICFAGVLLGKKTGALLSCRATIFGGVILTLIGLEIFITGLF